MRSNYYYNFCSTQLIATIQHTTYSLHPTGPLASFGVYFQAFSLTTGVISEIDCGHRHHQQQQLHNICCYSSTVQPIYLRLGDLIQNNNEN
jgi:hypothetical protein